MTVNELRAALDGLAGRGFGDAEIVVVRDGRQIVWTPEGGVWPALAAPNSDVLINFGDVGNEEPDLSAEMDERGLVVALG